MQEGAKIKQEIELLLVLRMLAQAYEEISVMKMQKVRSSVLRTRDFLEGLSGIYSDVRISYRQQIESLMKQKNTKHFSSFLSFKRNGKEAALFISSNAKLYGDIVQKVADLFIDSIKKQEIDIIVVGKFGREILESKKIGKPYVFFDVPDTELDINHLKPLISHIVEYEKVTVFHGKFINVINQEPVAVSISGEKPLEPFPDTPSLAEFRFLYEPNLEKILNFFETQIFTSLLKQTFHESSLARYASRIKAMEEALGGMDGRLKHYQSREKRIKNSAMNKKQLGTIAGMRLWGK